MIVAETSYEITEPTIDSQILRLKDAGADVLFSATTPKQAAQAIKKVARNRLEAAAYHRHQRAPRSARC